MSEMDKKISIIGPGDILDGDMGGAESKDAHQTRT
jgi:hypothetical protein